MKGGQYLGSRSLTLHGWNPGYSVTAATASVKALEIKEERQEEARAAVKPPKRRSMHVDTSRTQFLPWHHLGPLRHYPNLHVHVPWRRGTADDCEVKASETTGAKKRGRRSYCRGGLPTRAWNAATGGGAALYTHRPELRARRGEDADEGLLQGTFLAPPP